MKFTSDSGCAMPAPNSLQLVYGRSRSTWILAWGEFAPNCAEAGVLGVLPGVIGLLQATEVVKLLLGIGDSLAGRLLQFDALSMRFRETRLRHDPDCAVCAVGRPFPGYIDYAAFCRAG